MQLVVVEDARRCVVDLAPGAAVELGRQTRDELDPGHGPFTVHRDAAGVPRRMVVAWNSETAVARQHLGVEALADGRVRLTNLSATADVRFPDGRPPLRPGEAADVTPPVRVALPRRTITVEPAAADGDLHSLTAHPPAPGAPLPASVRHPPVLTGPQFDQLVDWLQATLGVLQGAVGGADFLTRAAEALVAIVGLESGWVLLRRDGRWAGRPENARDPDAWRPGDAVLDALVRERRTVWNRPGAAIGAAALSVLDGTGLPEKEVVAAPLLDAAGAVVGVLYGDLPAAPAGRSEGAPAALKAALVEVLACGVSAGLARERHEQAAARAEALFGQFFSDRLARQLRAEPDLLAGRTATVTVLFCDVRGYGTISSKLGPAATERWLHDVLGELSRCVLDEDGVLVDYFGDGLLAMWGAPAAQPDQTARAARAALAMLRAVAPLNHRWRGPLGGDMAVGVGVHRGEAAVGNCGSAYKFKYGPLGETVNVASRAEGLTKHLKCRLLVTGPARDHLPAGEFPARRVVRTRLVNIPDPVGLYEVTEAAPGVGDFHRASEAALDALERGDFAAATRLAGALLERHPGDGPAVLTLARGADALVRDGRGFDPVWTPPGK